MLQSVGEFDLHSQLAVIRCPVLVLHGNSDPMPVAFAERIRESIPGSELVIIPNSGHWLLADATEIFSKSVHEFSAGVNSTIP